MQLMTLLSSDSQDLLALPSCELAASDPVSQPSTSFLLQQG